MTPSMITLLVIAGIVLLIAIAYLNHVVVNNKLEKSRQKVELNDRIRRLVLQNGGRIPREDMDEIRGEVARYNERARGLSIPGVPLVKTSTIRQAIRSAKRPPRKERLRTNPNI